MHPRPLQGQGWRKAGDHGSHETGFLQSKKIKTGYTLIFFS
jgi:hypothetical protein